MSVKTYSYRIRKHHNHPVILLGFFLFYEVKLWRYISGCMKDKMTMCQVLYKTWRKLSLFSLLIFFVVVWVDSSLCILKMLFLNQKLYVSRIFYCCHIHSKAFPPPLLFKTIFWSRITVTQKNKLFLSGSHWRWFIIKWWEIMLLIIGACFCTL